MDIGCHEVWMQIRRVCSLMLMSFVYISLLPAKVTLTLITTSLKMNSVSGN